MNRFSPNNQKRKRETNRSSQSQELSRFRKKLKCKKKSSGRIWDCTCTVSVPDDRIFVVHRTSATTEVVLSRDLRPSLHTSGLSCSDFFQNETMASCSGPGTVFMSLRM